MTAGRKGIPRLIKLVDERAKVVEDTWRIVRNPEEALATHESGIVPLPRFLAMQEDEAARVRAVWIAPDDDFESSVPRLLGLDLIAVDFPNFRDGRGYSIARLLRTRYGWKKELRAIGDVLRDQLNYMRRCGFDAFAVRADKDIDEALESFDFYTVTYQGGVDDPLPLFRRRAV